MIAGTNELGRWGEPVRLRKWVKRVSMNAVWNEIPIK